MISFTISKQTLHELFSIEPLLVYKLNLKDYFHLHPTHLAVVVNEAQNRSRI
jgi:hypothetical protein